jgi:predicted nucleic acid-binding protein
VGSVILDASVIIAFLDPRDASHERAVSAIASTDERRIPASVLAEVLVHPHREGAAAVAKVERALAALATGVEPLTADIARAAASLRARHRRLRLGDALVIATGNALGVDILTVDRGFSGVSPRVRLV